MKPDTTMLELWGIKDAHSRRFGGDVKALCRHLMDKQEATHADMPLARDLGGSREAQQKRIAKLPAPVPGDVLLPDDPIIAEVRAIREQVGRESDSSATVVREEPSE